MIMESIDKLGFKITDVKILLNSHAHFDHAGGLAALQEASGAELWVSEGDAHIIASGGAKDPTIGPMRYLVYTVLSNTLCPALITGSRTERRSASGLSSSPRMLREATRPAVQRGRSRSGTVIVNCLRAMSMI